MTATIVMPVHGRAPLTRQSLEWLERGLVGRSEVEMVVVDDGSRDATQTVRRERSWVRGVRHDAARGFAAACNAGAEVASGDVLVFINNDLVPVEGWLDALLAEAAQERVAAVGAKLLYANETVQHAGVVICGDLRPRHVYRGFPRAHAAVCQSRDMAAVTAACVLVTREAFDAVGGFDTGFVNGFEDVDLCLRLRERGMRVRYCAESELYHLESATRRIDSDQERRDHERNEARFLERWGDRLVPDELTTYERDGLLVVQHTDVYPLRLRADPELALPGGADEDSAIAELLGIRARQVFDLLKQNMALRMRLGEVQFETAPYDWSDLAATIEPFQTPLDEGAEP